MRPPMRVRAATKGRGAPSSRAAPPDSPAPRRTSCPHAPSSAERVKGPRPPSRRARWRPAAQRQAARRPAWTP
eukprot:scaffold80222_cov30-Phaeocystis_antarctica.AAC.1